jgi:putative ABC transport system ATP-binding protein
MGSSALQVVDVTKRFGSGATEVTAVRSVSLTIDHGEVVLIMGPSGSGKTTLLMMLGALLMPTEGTIRLNGQVISDLDESQLPEVRLRHVGFVFQDFNLLSALTALRMAWWPPWPAENGEARQRAEAELTRLGLGERLGFCRRSL